MRRRECERLNGGGVEHVDGGDHGVDAPVSALGAVGQPQHGNDERDVRLHGGDDVGGGGVVVGRDRE